MWQAMLNHLLVVPAGNSASMGVGWLGVERKRVWCRLISGTRMAASPPAVNYSETVEDGTEGIEEDGLS